MLPFPCGTSQWNFPHGIKWNHVSYLNKCSSNTKALKMWFVGIQIEIINYNFLLGMPSVLLILIAPKFAGSLVVIKWANPVPLFYTILYFLGKMFSTLLFPEFSSKSLFLMSCIFLSFLHILYSRSFLFLNPSESLRNDPSPFQNWWRLAREAMDLGA